MNVNDLLSELKYQIDTVRYGLGSRQKGLLRQKVLVNGSPRTGTTWTVAMIASVPGYRKAGNFQHDFALYRAAAPGDVIHGHDHCSDELKKILHEAKIKAVFLMRDPRDQMVSRLFHTRRNSNHAWQGHLQKLSDDEGLMACIEGLDPKSFPGVKGLTSITKSWLAHYPDGKLIRYEHLISQPETTMAAVFQHLNIDVPPPLLRMIVERNSFQRMTVGRKFWKKGRKRGQEDKQAHIRKGIVGDWKNHFKPHHVERFKELAGDVLIDFEYEKDHAW